MCPLGESAHLKASNPSIKSPEGPADHIHCNASLPTARLLHRSACTAVAIETKLVADVYSKLG